MWLVAFLFMHCVLLHCYWFSVVKAFRVQQKIVETEDENFHKNG